MLYVYVFVLLLSIISSMKSTLTCRGHLNKTRLDLMDIMRGLPPPQINMSSSIYKIFRDLDAFGITKNESSCYNWDCKSPARLGEHCVFCLPRVFIAGVSKCGTTAMCRKLAAHPDIKPYRKKEINIFTKFMNYSWNVFERRVVDTHTNKIAKFWMDCSSGAFRDLNVAAALAKYSKKTKIIFMVRDPWQRLGSVLAMLRRNNDPPTYRMMLQKMLKKYRTHAWSDYVRMHPRGIYHFAKVNDFFYAEIILNWLRVIPKKNIMAVDQYELEFSPNETIRKVEDFIDVSHFNYDNETLLSVSKNTVNEVGANSVDSAQFEFSQNRSRQGLEGGRIESMMEGSSIRIHAPYEFTHSALKRLTSALFRPSLCLFRIIFEWDIEIVTKNIV